MHALGRLTNTRLRPKIEAPVSTRTESSMRRLTVRALIATTIATFGSAGLLATPVTAVAQGAPVRYTARQFFETTSYSMPSSAAYAFSADGRNLLVSSDRSGVFNGFLLPVKGGGPAPVT